MGKIWFKEEGEAKAVLKGIRDTFTSYETVLTVVALKNSLALDADNIKYKEETKDDSKYGWTWKEIGDVIDIGQVFKSDPMDRFEYFIDLPTPVKLVKDPDYYIVHLQMDSDEQYQEYKDVINITSDDGFLCLETTHGSAYFNLNHLIWYWFRKNSASSNGDE